jgi:Zn-dependent peptidase ImmA (M78 family)
VSTTKELHRRAMEMFESALAARRDENETLVLKFLTEALRFESAAADSVADDYSLEPTRSVLHRSAASLALQMFDTNTARRYVDAALKGEPPEEIKEELQTLSDQITVLDAERADYRLKAPVGRTPIQNVIRRFTDNVPVDIIGLATALGITVIESDLGANAGEIFRDIRRGGFSGYSILVNANDPNIRQRYTIGHEIAHFLRHRDRVKNRLVDDRMYRSGHGRTVEDEADALAADLLMPRRMIAQFRAAGLKSVEELAAKFDVSVPAMKRRLGIRSSRP